MPSSPHPETSPKARHLRVQAARHAADLLDRLRLLVHYSPETGRQIERRAGFARGYLSELLGGSFDLRVEQALALILALDLHPAEFFDGLFTEPSDHALEKRPRKRDVRQALSLELAKRYGVGLDGLGDLLRRLEAYEASQRHIESSDPSSAGPRPSASLCDG